MSFAWLWYLLQLSACCYAWFTWPPPCYKMPLSLTLCQPSAAILLHLLLSTKDGRSNFPRRWMERVPTGWFKRHGQTNLLAIVSKILGTPWQHCLERTHDQCWCLLLLALTFTTSLLLQRHVCILLVYGGRKAQDVGRAIRQREEKEDLISVATRLSMSWPW